jgi:formamidopyrimidine-DNA glycosylase
VPELPDLEVIREYLAPRLTGRKIVAAQVRRPIVVRNLVGGEITEHLAGRQVSGVGRRAKFLLLSLETGLYLVFHPMLAGRLRYGEPLGRHRVRDVLVLDFDDHQELRYHDARDMGKIYLTADLDQVPDWVSLGPEATDPALTLAVFRERMRPYRGEIKGVLTNQRFVAGIGNAYADEICWRARIYPFRRRPSLSREEVDRLYEAMRDVLAEAIDVLRERVGGSIDVEIRDFMAIHGRAGEPCPRCGTPISEVKRARRATNFCRTCQPGLLVRR